MATKKPAAPSNYCLYIELDGVTPPIWRRFWIEGSATLGKLHHTIQAVMGWGDYHLHEFQIGGVTYAEPDPENQDLGSPPVDERKAVLSKVLEGISSFGYQYDFGDSWQHSIKIEKIEAPSKYDLGCAVVEEGARACPPEDAGGAHLYQVFLEQYAKNPKHKDVREFLRWAGEDFDPERFDRHAINATLTRMASNRWGNS